MSKLYTYRFYLRFKNDNSFGRIEITEPLGFDSINFIVEQDNKRYGRDLYKISDEIDLDFRDVYTEPTTPYTLPNGTVASHLSMGLPFILETYKEYGFESNIDFEIEADGIVFEPANLDFQTSQTDKLTYFKCKALQQQGRQIIKRREDVSVDVFSSENLDGEPIIPVQTENILLKAKPITQISEWGLVEDVFDDGDPFTSPFYTIIKSGIEDTLTPYGDFATVNLKAKTNLTNLKLIFTDNRVVLRNKVSTPQTTLLRVKLIDPLNNVQYTTIDSITTFNTNEDVVWELQQYDLPNLPVNWSIKIEFDLKVFVTTTFFGTQIIRASSNAVNTVVKGVRYIDLIKQNLKSINNYNVDAHNLDVGGKYYEQFAFNGNLIKQRLEDPFYVTFKDLMNDLQELNQDYQILNDKIYIGEYSDFYANKEIGAFLTAPDDNAEFTFNERYAINTFEYKYKNFEQDRDEENTTDAIHTETQWLLSNRQVENSKSIEINHIRDAFALESARKLAFKETTSTSDDDKIFLLDVVEIAPNTKSILSSTLSHTIQSGKVLLLKETSLPSWRLLGFDVGDGFEILSGLNVGTYTVFEIQDDIITLTPVLPASQSQTGEAFTQVEYPITNVQYTNRTNEGLVNFENLLNADNYSNLKYSIKRNIESWKQYLATACLYAAKTIRNTFFKSNGNASTQFNNEAGLIKENAPITGLDNPIITPLVYNLKLVANLDDVNTLVNSINTINNDKSIAGFMRVLDNNGKVLKVYPKQIEYSPSISVLEVTGEERFESDKLIITITETEVIINEVGYNLDTLLDPFYEMDGDYLKIYDSNKLPVINPTKFDNVEIDGNKFIDPNSLLQYLIDLTP